MDRSQKFWNPYVAGVVLGLVLLASLVIMGKGLGASGTAYRLAVFAEQKVAPAHVARNPALGATVAKGHPLDDWLVFEVLGVFLGGAVAATSAGRMKLGVLGGPNVGARTRLSLALAGGVLMGMAARMARGCTSGQALSGGALLSVGSFAFMFSVFAGGYALAIFVRRQWT